MKPQKKLTGKTLSASSKVEGKQNGNKAAPDRALRIALTYAALGALWIWVSDRMVEWIFSEEADMIVAQTIKGLFFIAVTGFLVYCLSRRAGKEIRNELLEKQLRSAEELLSATLSSLGEAVFFVDPANRIILQCNPAAEKLFGYRQEELVGQPTEMLHVNHETFLEFASLSEPSLRTGLVFNGEFQMKQKDGRVITTEHTVSTLHDNFLREEGVISIIRDITEREESRKRLEASERRFRTVFEKANDGILIAEAATGCFLYSNPAVTSILGYSQEEIPGMKVEDLHPREHLERILADFKAVAEGRIDFSPEIPCLRKDGGIAYVDIKAAVMDIDGRRCNVGFFRDVTEAVHLREEKRALEAQLRHSQKLEAIGILAGGVAHEINNPIMGIKGYAELIGDEVPEDSCINTYARHIRQETDRVQTIIQNLLNFARREKKEEPQSWSLHDIIEATLTLVRTIMRHDQITIEADVPADLPEISCHNQQIQQVLLNLLTNARDALNDKYIGFHKDKLIQIRTEAFSREGRTWLRTTVEDHGPGIPEEIRMRMFEPFYTTKPEGKGTGLGLSIIHGIIKDHGGTIEVETETGKFSRFHLDLPAAQ